MAVPKHPLLASMFAVNVVTALQASGLAGRLSGRPEWPAVIIGLILLLGGLTTADGRYRKYAGEGYPPRALWLTFGVLPGLATASFWGGLVITANAVPVHCLLSVAGLAAAALGVLISVGIAAWPRRRV